MAVDSKSRLKEIIDSYLDKDGGAGIDTGIVAGHLQHLAEPFLHRRLFLVAQSREKK